MKNNRLLREWLPAAAILLMYIIAASYKIELPGFYNDEAIFLIPAVSIYLGTEIDAHNQWCCVDDFFGMKLLLMDATDYTSAVPAYLTIPFFALFGIGIKAARYMTLFFAVLTLFFTYLLSKKLFGREVGILSMLLLATNPWYFEWTRLGLMASSTMIFFSTSGLYCLVVWLERKKNYFLYVGAFLLGFGASIKINFWWFLGGITIAALTVALLRWKYKMPGEIYSRFLKQRNILHAVVFFAFGAFMIILHNIARPLITVGLITASSKISYFGVVDNSDIISNFLKRLAQTESLYGSVTYIIYITIIAVVILTIFKYMERESEGPLSIAILCIAMLFFSSFTITSLAKTHLYILYPFPIIIAAFGFIILMQHICDAFRHPTVRSTILSSGGIISVLLLVYVLMSNVSGVASYLTDLEQTGGHGVFSDAIYPLTEYLENQNSKVYAMDWGFKHNVKVLSKGRVDPEEIFILNDAGGSYTSPEIRMIKQKMNESFQGQGIYLFHTEMWTKIDMKKIFDGTLKDTNKRAILERTFYQRDGTPVYLVYRVVPNHAVNETFS